MAPFCISMLLVQPDRLTFVFKLAYLMQFATLPHGPPLIASMPCCFKIVAAEPLLAPLRQQAMTGLPNFFSSSMCVPIRFKGMFLDPCT